MNKELLQKYLLPSEHTYVDLCRRVASAIATNTIEEETFFQALIHKEFIPASMTLFSAGDADPCYCSDIAIPWDEKEVVIKALEHGLGCSLHIPNTQLNLSDTLPSFLLSFKNVLQRNKRPGATMLTCDESHPEINDFIELKNTHRDLTHINFSVILSSKELLPEISSAAHACGDPGIINKNNFLEGYVAPCGQMSLVEWQSVPYAHINLARMVDGEVFDVHLFFQTLSTVKLFLHNALKKQDFISEKNKQVSLEHKKIGIGVVGLHELLSKLRSSPKEEDSLKLYSFIAHSLGSDGSISPTGATSRLLGVTPGMESKDVLTWKQELEIVDCFQKNISGAISKTIVLPSSATVHVVENIFSAVFDSSLKGITVYRESSLED